MKTTCKTLCRLLPAVIIVLGLMAPTARADTMYLSLPNSAVSGEPGPYVKLEVDLTSSTTATITATSQTEGGIIYLMGGGDALGLEVNGTAFTASGLTESNAGTGFTVTAPGEEPQIGICSPLPSCSNGSEDGFGKFNLQVMNFDGFTHSADTISFTLTLTSGGTWSSAANVLTNNNMGSEAAAHIFATTSPANGSNTAIVTGYAGNGPAPVTEPASVLLLGAGLLGFGMFRKKVGHRL
jgi:hypothetical protein